MGGGWGRHGMAEAVQERCQILIITPILYVTYWVLNISCTESKSAVVVLLTALLKSVLKIILCLNFYLSRNRLK